MWDSQICIPGLCIYIDIEDVSHGDAKAIKATTNLE